MLTYGKNDAEVHAVLDRLAALEPLDWARLEEAHTASAGDELYDAMGDVLARTDLRPAWFDLRATTAVTAAAAAVRYAEATDEQARSIGHNRTANTWVGEVEVETFELLPPVHEMAFRDAAAWAAGVMMMRRYLSEAAFTNFWAPYATVLDPITEDL
ncbi:MAG: hypothetical protein ABIZ34_01330 [Candidatus Limnocylindrales bacterium]